MIGRSDLAGSYNLAKSEVDSNKIFKLLKSKLKKIKNKKKLIKMGGSITQNSEEFIAKLFKKKILDRVETRNIELKLNNHTLKNFKTIIPLIFKFEKEWLRYRSNHFRLNKISKKSISKRIEELNTRENFK